LTRGKELFNWNATMAGIHLYVGDLAFFAVILGMPGQSSGCCLSCNQTSANLNSICDEDAFSIEAIKRSLQMLEQHAAPAGAACWHCKLSLK
jgi:hypothetical protein